MYRSALTLAWLVGCGSTSSTTTTTNNGPSAAERAAKAQRVEAERAEAERVRRSKLSAAHRELEDEQATALAAKCEKPAQPAEARCLPSCYAVEAADPRAGTKLKGPVEITHLVCKRADDGPFMIADEIGGAKLAVRAVRGRFPKGNKSGTWQAEVEAAASAALKPELARGDVVRVMGEWKPSMHPATKERLQCVAVSHYTKSKRGALDRCGGRGKLACEAMGNSAAHGLNVVRYRLVEATQLQAAGKEAECQQAAREAVAIARGMPRWRQYATLNTAEWKAFPRYRTRFDGVLDEDALFTLAIQLGTEAQAVYAACGGGGNPKTTAAEEQSFHTCW
ncbi:MAG: hypothetical protein H0T89_17090 [Deltaproteobacteria bacterium]|nr:hypothetical protein [Deltaproteobacteria bacterium]MDQ3294979.1 hypothetical protein [Myxococcota bacterium]